MRSLLLRRRQKDYEKYEDTNFFDDQSDMTEAPLSISIGMLGIASSTQQKWLLYFEASVSFIGIVLGATAFLKINLHFYFISKIQG